MAKRNDKAAGQAAYRKLKQDLRQGTVGSLYLFHGEEAYLRDHYLDQMKAKLIPPGMESFNYHRLAGKTLTAQRLAETVDALPMMSPRTLIVVQDYDLFKAPEGERKAITQLLEDLPEYCCLVFVYDTLAYKRDARMKKLAGVLQDKGQEVPFLRQETGDLVDWIGRRFRALGHDIDTADAQYLIFLCGDLMHGLIGEIEKIGAYAQGRRVTRQDIDAVAIPVIDAVVFQMTDALSRRQTDKAFSVLTDLLRLPAGPHYRSWPCWESTSASSTPPGWPWKAARAAGGSWSCGGCAPPTPPTNSWRGPATTTWPGAKPPCAGAQRPTWP